MIPSYFVWLEEMPLTPNGKLDRKALPEPEGRVETEYVAPRSRTEEVLAQIWSELLDRKRIGIYDNFFELGGHSLTATVLASRIHKELNVELPLKELFRNPTISGVSDYLLTSAKESVYMAIEPVEEKEYYETSSAQKRMWLLQQFDHASTGYNMPGVLMMDGSLDKSRLEDAFSRLITRHETLRTSFHMIGEELVQSVSEKVNFEIKHSETCEGDIEDVIKEFIRPFELDAAPLLRVGLVKVSENRHFLLFDMHHIISDGVSMTILTQEFMTLYKGDELEEQRIQYKDFSAWQNEFQKSERMNEQENYWLEQFSEEVPVLNLPLDYARPATQAFVAKRINCR